MPHSTSVRFDDVDSSFIWYSNNNNKVQLFSEHLVFSFFSVRRNRSKVLFQDFSFLLVCRFNFVNQNKSTTIIVVQMLDLEQLIMISVCISSAGIESLTTASSPASEYFLFVFFFVVFLFVLASIYFVSIFTKEKPKLHCNLIEQYFLQHEETVACWILPFSLRHQRFLFVVSRR